MLSRGHATRGRAYAILPGVGHMLRACMLPGVGHVTRGSKACHQGWW